jgi:hypothetical protein
LIILSATAYAQKDVTQFLDIPVDGYKSEMIKKLKSRGYTTEEGTKDNFEGEFNGKDVNISIATNNNKVYRIFIKDKYSTNEANIKIRFNTLIQQFQNNERYFTETDSIVSEFIIPEDEDISYEMSVRSKRYQATFNQKGLKLDSIFSEIEVFKKDGIIDDEIYQKKDSIKYKKLQSLFVSAIVERTIADYKRVWFMIDKEYNEYRILMFYDNVYNEANGKGL